MTETEFKRARQPEQVAARRDSILAAARQLLSQRPLADISLRELSAEVGLAKSNVLRYFESREAVFLEILVEEWRAWRAALAPVLERLRDNGTGGDDTVEEALAQTVARTLLDRPLLCDLVSSMAGVLERNIGIDFARAFKRESAQHNAELIRLLSSVLPWLSPEQVFRFVAAVWLLVAGLWPYATPTPTIRQATQELGEDSSAERLASQLAEALTDLLAGMRSRSAQP